MAHPKELFRNNLRIMLAQTLWITLKPATWSKSYFVTIAKYAKPQEGNKTVRKDAKWICDLYTCGMVKPSFILLYFRTGQICKNMHPICTG